MDLIILPSTTCVSKTSYSLFVSAIELHCKWKNRKTHHRATSWFILFPNGVLKMSLSLHFPHMGHSLSCPGPFTEFFSFKIIDGDVYKDSSWAVDTCQWESKEMKGKISPFWREKSKERGKIIRGEWEGGCRERQTGKMVTQEKVWILITF